MQIGSVAHKLLRLFAYRGGMPGYRIGDLITAGGLQVGTAVHQRLTLDLEHRGEWRITRRVEKGIVFYWMDPRERQRAKAFLRDLAAQHRAKEFSALKETA
jgi:hypothetical protein